MKKALNKCLTVENLINALEKSLPKIKKLILKGRISLKDFNSQKFNSCELSFEMNIYWLVIVS